MFGCAIHVLVARDLEVFSTGALKVNILRGSQNDFLVVSP